MPKPSIIKRIIVAAAVTAAASSIAAIPVETAQASQHLVHAHDCWYKANHWWIWPKWKVYRGEPRSDHAFCGWYDTGRNQWFNGYHLVHWEWARR